MGKFATPQWDSNTVGDEICNNLFKLDGKSKGKRKEKLKNGGKIVKAKLKKTKKQINEKLVKNFGENLDQIKNFVSKKKNKINQQKQQTLECNNSNTSNGNQVNTSHEKLRKKKKKPKLKNLPNIKHMKNMLKTKLSSGEEDQKNLFSEDADHTFSGKNQEENKSKNKRKKKKLKNLQKDMTEKIKSEIVEAEKKTKKKRKKSKSTISDEGIKTEDWNINDTLVSNSVEDMSLVKKSNNNKTLSLRERMLAKLKSSRFRYLNEQLYCSPSKDAQNMFKSDPDSFKAYHEGFRQQVDRWPVNPVDIIIKSIKKMNKSHEIADFGCGDAKIAQEVKQKVHSFDLAATNERVTACDMANVPLAKESVDVAVFCLSLMGTNLQDYLKEANRVLKIGGILKIAEVESRFDDVEAFIKGVQCFGFQNIYKDLSHNLFYFMDFKKVANTKKGKGLPNLSLNPCLYKKR